MKAARLAAVIVIGVAMSACHFAGHLPPGQVKNAIDPPPGQAKKSDD
jgi:hypothetical protein